MMCFVLNDVFNHIWNIIPHDGFPIGNPMPTVVGISDMSVSETGPLGHGFSIPLSHGEDLYCFGASTSSLSGVLSLRPQ